MNALWLENNQISLRDVPQPQTTNIVENEAIIKIRKAGICSTDLELVKGYYPYTGVLGHEFVGDVVEADDTLWIGQRVVGEINSVCHQCEQCMNGRPTHCEHRTVLGIVNRDVDNIAWDQLTRGNFLQMSIEPDTYVRNSHTLEGCHRLLGPVFLSKAEDSV